MRAEPLTLREAVAGDCRFVWETNNDPSTRRWSIVQRDIPWEEHAAWFARALELPQRTIYVGELADTPCAVVRFDDEGVATVISVAVSVTSRGRGVGAAVIDQSTRRHLGLRPTLQRALARIRPDNAASVAAFVRAGYQRIGETAIGGVTLDEYALDRETLMLGADPSDAE